MQDEGKVPAHQCQKDALLCLSGEVPHTKKVHGNSSLTLYSNDAVPVAEIAMLLYRM